MAQEFRSSEPGQATQGATLAPPRTPTVLTVHQTVLKLPSGREFVVAAIPTAELPLITRTDVGPNAGTEGLVPAVCALLDVPPDNLVRGETMLSFMQHMRQVIPTSGTVLTPSVSTHPAPMPPGLGDVALSGLTSIIAGLAAGDSAIPPHLVNVSLVRESLELMLVGSRDIELDRQLLALRDRALLDERTLNGLALLATPLDPLAVAAALDILEYDIGFSLSKTGRSGMLMKLCQGAMAVYFVFELAMLGHSEIAHDPPTVMWALAQSQLIGAGASGAGLLILAGGHRLSEKIMGLDESGK